MLLRILLILTILAGIGTIALTQFKVRPHIQDIISAREFQNNRANTAERNLRDTKKKLSGTEAELQSTKKELDTTTVQLNTTKQDLKVSRGQVEKLNKELISTQGRLRSAEQNLSAWDALRIPVEGVKALIETEKKLRADIEALTAENQIVTEQRNRAQEKVRIYEEGRGEDLEVPLPPGIRGKVLVVDVKWKFVVLSVGRVDKVEENGVLLVSREGRLVAKVKVKRVQENRCIANVMPGWSFDEILEGDVVLN
ncbi:MAG: hypothetical protein JXQ71_00420 [Verrucomicrobia bacterium]|nr:hypothetical protein [Verrucomicrobiota bacterium]